MYKILPREEVTYKDGTPGVKGAFVIMRDDYPKPVHFEVFGHERLAAVEALPTGTAVRISFYAESHESKNGSYFTTLRCTNVMQLSSVATDSSTQKAQESGTSPQESLGDDNEIILPF